MTRETDFTALRDELFARIDERDAQPERPSLDPYTRALRGCKSVQAGVEILVARGLLPTSGVEAPGRYFLLSSAKGPRHSTLPTPPGAVLFGAFGNEPLFASVLPPSLPALARTARDLSLIARSEELARESAARYEAAWGMPSAPVRVLHRLTAAKRGLHPEGAPRVYWAHENDFVERQPDGYARLFACARELGARCEKGRGKDDISAGLFAHHANLLALLRGGGAVARSEILDADVPQPLVGRPWSEAPDPIAPLIDAAVRDSVLLGLTNRMQGEKNGMGYVGTYTAYIKKRVGTDVYFWQRDPETQGA